ncbi:MAG: hypothetical protein LBP78_02825 [Acidaminococcales bacterium]|nr:hypothetical protein [Acidaminococcales bacterium]
MQISMKNMIKKSLPVAALLLITLFAAACGQLNQLDVVGKNSIASFGDVLKTIPDKITPDGMNGGWSLAAPDGQARFVWSSDFSKSPMHDAMIELDARPFVAAGLDAAKLPESILFHDDKIMVGTKLGGGKPKYQGEPTPLASYEQIVALKRDAIGYHAALDHYGVDLGGGNLFEWAKDMSKNDKDIVFVLNPEPFIKAGVDVRKVDGWLFGKVPVDVDGKPAEVDKLLKPFNLK